MESQLHVALESSPLAFAILCPLRDADQQVSDFLWSYLNPAAARVLGSDPVALIRQPIGPLLSRSWEASGLIAACVRALASGRSEQLEVRPIHNGGSALCARIACLGRELGIWFTEVGAHRPESDAVADITERKRLEVALLEANRRMDEFLAILSHELRGPLAPLRNGLQILRLTRTADTRLAAVIDMMDRQTLQLTRLVDDLLDVSRLSMGKIALRRAPLKVAEVLASSIEACRGAIEAQGHQLQVDLGAPEVKVLGDFERLTQAFSNLLMNSVKYTPYGGCIGVVLDREGSEVVVRIIDNGIGIAHEDLEAIFEMFSQGRLHGREAAGGLGIGLSLVRSLVQVHDGTVRAYSAGPECGSAFVVRLPLAGESDARAASPAAADTAPPLPSSRILVVDDNADAASSLAQLLQLKGHEVLTAGDGLQAVECARRFRPRLIFMDIGLPCMDGVEAIRRVRALQSGAQATIVALTGWGQADVRERTASVGADFHLMKPVSDAALAQVLDAALPLAPLVAMYAGASGVGEA